MTTKAYCAAGIERTANITGSVAWGRMAEGHKVSKCGTFEICGGSSVGFSLWAHGWRISEFDRMGDAKVAADALLSGASVPASWRIWTRGSERVERADKINNGWLTLADIATL